MQVKYFVNISNTKYVLVVLKDSFAKLLFMCRKKMFLKDSDNKILG
jgi:hypothetical protein